MTTPKVEQTPSSDKPSRLRRAGKGLLWVLGAGLVLFAVTLVGTTSMLETFGASAQGARLDRIKRSPQYKDGQFTNVIPTTPGLKEGRGWSTMTRFLFGDEKRIPDGQLPMATGTVERWKTAPVSGLRVTWLGHSTMLLEIDGVTVLADPVWGQRASPSSVVGPKRYHQPPVSLSQLPSLDAVVISHDHYDHLDMPTIKALAQTTDVHFYVPLAVGAHLEFWGVPTERIHEMDWYEEAQVGALKVVSTPCRHFSGRKGFDRNSTLWTSWAFVGPQHRVYFGGDSGMTPQFEEIGERFGPFDLTMLEVGAYNENWGDIHLGPHQALKAHKMLQGKVLLPIHWGTFVLAPHAWDSPPETLIDQAPSAGVKLAMPILAQPIEPSVETPLEPWWRSVR